jgi:hypothetical protein
MSERLVPAGSGVSTVYVGERTLHSRYDPLGEAEKYVHTLNLKDKRRFLILIEPGLGYIIPFLREKHPAAKVLALHVSDFFASPVSPPSTDQRADAEWRPGMGGLQDFLEREIPDTPAAELGIVEWRPALAAYGEAYRKVLAETVDFIKRIDANQRTVRNFGRRWFRNVFRNIRLFKNLISFPSGSLPLVITGAGPSLEETIPLIREHRGALGILAVSSSVPALIAGGIAPDMVISADGGGWALLHLYETIRGFFPGKGPVPILAASLSAALPSQCTDMPILPIGDGSRWQALILKKLGIPPMALPQRGTVTASALDLAFCITQGNIFITGMDLAHRDIRSHARPYGFDRLQDEQAHRLNPVYSQCFVRSGLMNAGGSHGIYATWFEGQLAAYPKRLFSLGNNNPVFNALKGKPGEPPPLSPAGTEETANRDAVFLRGGHLELRVENAGKLAQQALLEALETPESSIAEELSPLLFPDRSAVSPEELSAEIVTLTRTYCGGTVHG